jgi:hypothetical protein
VLANVVSAAAVPFAMLNFNTTGTSTYRRLSNTDIKFGGITLNDNPLVVADDACCLTFVVFDDPLYTGIGILLDPSKRLSTTLIKLYKLSDVFSVSDII